MRPAKRDTDPLATSHAGPHGDFSIVWQRTGWWVVFPHGHDLDVGPFHTSQAAFGAVKDVIDELLIKEVAMKKFTLQHVPLNSGGYTAQGQYFGHGARLYWYSDDDGREGFIRVKDRDDAKKFVRQNVDCNAKFYR